MAVACMWGALVGVAPAATAAGCYPPPCSSESGTGTPVAADQLSTALRPDVAGSQQSPTPVVLAGLTMIFTVFCAITLRRKLSITRRSATVFVTLPLITPHQALEPERSSR
jgi:hypothetical protein